MSPPKTPYLQKHRTRHGVIAWYVRVPGLPLVRLREDPGSPEFWAAYQSALDGNARHSKPQARSGTVQWLWEAYRKSDDWKRLSIATHRQRENIMDGVLRAIGSKPAKAVQRQDIVASRDRRADTPAQARNFLDAMRGLFRWAVDAGKLKVDPTDGVKNPARRSGPGFPIWTESDIAAYEDKWPIGTKERVWLDVLCYTGLRRGDAVRLGPAHVAAGFLEPEKTDLAIPITILPILQATLDAGPIGRKTFIVGKNGKPLTKETFGNFFKAACRAAGVSKSAHGLRKIAATRAANAGATVAELEALFGWSGGGMASLYTRAADRARLARGAASKMGK